MKSERLHLVISGRVQGVQQAITYLGTREVAAVTFEMGLRAVFPQAAELAPIWERAARRGACFMRVLGSAVLEKEEDVAVDEAAAAAAS